MKHSVIVHRLYQQHKALTRNLNQNTLQSHWKRVVGRKQCVLRIEKYYKQVISFDLVLQCCVDSVMEIRSPQKIVLSTSSKRLVQDQKELIVGLSALKMISGQKSQSARARKSIAAFKLREGSVLGCKTTLRRKAIYSFLDKLIFLVLPRARASLVNRNMDANNNYNIGISNPFVFMELESHYDLFQSLQGINIALINSNFSSNCSSLLLLNEAKLMVIKDQQFTIIASNLGTPRSGVTSQVSSEEPAYNRETSQSQVTSQARVYQRSVQDRNQISTGNTKQKVTSPNEGKISSIALLLSGLQIQVD